MRSVRICENLGVRERVSACECARKRAACACTCARNKVEENSRENGQVSPERMSECEDLWGERPDVKTSGRTSKREDFWEMVEA